MLDEKRPTIGYGGKEPPKPATRALFVVLLVVGCLAALFAAKIVFVMANGRKGERALQQKLWEDQTRRANTAALATYLRAGGEPTSLPDQFKGYAVFSTPYPVVDGVSIIAAERPIGDRRTVRDMDVITSEFRVSELYLPDDLWERLRGGE